MEPAVEWQLAGGPGPTVVLINGAGGPMEGWFRLLPELEKDFVVFRYNRPGLGKSAPATVAQTGAVMVATLRRMLTEASAPEPYLLVGHSFGGLIAELYARTSPAAVSSVLFLESSTVDDVEGNRASGRLRLGNTFSETDQILETVAQLRSAPPFPAVPVAVVVGTKKPLFWQWRREALEQRWANEEALVGLSPRSFLVEAARSGHFPQFSQPELVIATIRRLSEG